MLNMFNNNTYTDFRTANKHILIPSYVIRVIKEWVVTFGKGYDSKSWIRIYTIETRSRTAKR